MTQESEVKYLVAVVLELTGRLDHAAISAGIYASIWDEEDSIITTELFVRCDSIPNPNPGQSGAIDNIVSVSGLYTVGLAAYTPSKCGAATVMENGAKFYGLSGI
ncbi:hypothetical protein Z517_08514 [Fonsecaea pedrosoi CBS 271.37]|uniref:Uncharacterized protein n=1 Tax=Fonsecaea pedrosoi CBS 271.37 TaxID=1442368 RepID=A0A0D2DLX7_9EURO|nr:uncharacterized protein Z517_08514 [Fonsecaea pedrosoi CBS 271.37]KIW78676.1 hypothetical protein Z517_08514 [Fonsecaea pedrosoi CBS 271.37]